MGRVLKPVHQLGRFNESNCLVRAEISIVVYDPVLRGSYIPLGSSRHSICVSYLHESRESISSPDQSSFLVGRFGLRGPDSFEAHILSVCSAYPNTSAASLVVSILPAMECRGIRLLGISGSGSGAVSGGAGNASSQEITRPVSAHNSLASLASLLSMSA
jgi:hypothetical protein